jgi:integrase
MKGHIRPRGPGTWALVIDVGRDHTGKRRQKWHTVRGTKKDAERELAKLVNDLNSGGYVEQARMSLAEYLDQWLESYARSNTSPKTYERYRDLIRGHVGPALGGLPLTKVTPIQIQSFYSEALKSGRKDGKGGLSPQTVLHIHRVLHKALKQAVKWQMLMRNPSDAVEPPRPERTEMTALDQKGIALLLQAVDGTRMYMPVLLAITTGLRRGEILALRWKDLDLENARISVRQSVEQTAAGLRFKAPKTAKGRRVVAMPEYLVDALRAHRARQAELRLRLGNEFNTLGLVCPRDDGEPWLPNTFTPMFAKLAEAAKIDVRFHDLRHTHATQLLEQGIHPKIVSERLGHATIAITLDTYSHVLPDMQEGAAKAIDMAIRAATANGAT